jgi:hypothetical protein
MAYKLQNPRQDHYTPSKRSSQELFPAPGQPVSSSLTASPLFLARGESPSSSLAASPWLAAHPAHHCLRHSRAPHGHDPPGPSQPASLFPARGQPSSSPLAASFPPLRSRRARGSPPTRHTALCGMPKREQTLARRRACSSGGGAPVLCSHARTSRRARGSAGANGGGCGMPRRDPMLARRLFVLIKSYPRQRRSRPGCPNTSAAPASLPASAPRSPNTKKPGSQSPRLPGPPLSRLYLLFASHQKRPASDAGHSKFKTHPHYKTEPNGQERFSITPLVEALVRL